MRWEDERYVRVYTRDTTEWISMEWQGRAVFYELCRKVDRSGFLELGKSGNRGLAGLLRMPVEIVDAGVPALLEDGCLVRVEGGLLIRNFIEAQEAKQSDLARKRSQRERDRDSKRATAGDGQPVTNPDDHGRGVTPPEEPGQPVTHRDEESRTVTESHGPSRDVTDGHGPSRLVTLSCAEPSLAVPESHTLAGARAEQGQGQVADRQPEGLTGVTTPEVLLTIIAPHAMLAQLRGDERWAQDASGGLLAGGCRAVDANAAVCAFVTDNAGRRLDRPELIRGLGGYLKNAKMYADTARGKAAKAAAPRGGPPRGAQPQPGPMQVADKGHVPPEERMKSLV